MCGQIFSAITSLLGAGAPAAESGGAVSVSDAPRQSDAEVKVASTEPRPTGKIKLSGKKRQGAQLPGLGL